MVVKKRTYSGGFHDLLAPVIPRAPRSLRRRILRNKASEDGGICAFELLADVADKLLQEQESESSTSSISSKGKRQISIPDDGIKNELRDVKVKSVVSEQHILASGAEPTNLDLSLKESQHSDNDSGSDHTSIVTNADLIKKVNSNLIMEAIEDKSGNLCNANYGDNSAEIHPKAIEEQSLGLTSVKTYSLKDHLEPCVNTRVLNKSASSVHLSFCKDLFHSPRHRGNVKVNSRDDDEKYFRYTNRSNTRLRGLGSRSRARYTRMRKMIPSRYWKVAQTLRDYELQNGTGMWSILLFSKQKIYFFTELKKNMIVIRLFIVLGSGAKSFYQKRKNIYMRERFQADVVYKRRKLFHQSSRNPCIKKESSESMPNLVKFSIKSFKVPELYVEVPETATVGSLKRSVMEAVTAILHGQLHVGVLVQGKKVRDDNRTLQQSGISKNCNLESLGFTLEPSLPEGSSLLLQQETPSCNMQEQLCRSPSSPDIGGGLSNSSADHPFPATATKNRVETNEVSTTFAAEVTPLEDSKALVLAPAVDAEALAVVPLSEKPAKKFEFSQRRTRRPFSVSEVEALVEAVETLGAGRWRDVKMRAFDDANHRTYVDLKDKWKTLVHTASIAPQQRRGEPVPQDLLDRVLAAHAYWSQHQAKQHAKKNQKTLEAQM
ncbi:putative transcription factor MYB-HB-like family [Helianthus annuus]|nr:putative transcription factor MYB-HB-like family [Helianthus annuus]